VSEIQILVLVLSLEGLLFVAIGYAMPRMRTSRLVGVRFPQTMADERVWRDTHIHTAPRFRRLGWAILLGGLLLTALPLPDWLTLAAFSVLSLGGLAWVILDAWRYSKAREVHYRRVDEAVRQTAT
jgi:uncharacterized membrane protein